MDYSAAIAEDPIEPSPWGSSSPRAQRAPFAGATPDSPTTPSRSGHAASESQSSLGEPALPTSQPPISAIEQHNQIVEGQSQEPQSIPQQQAQAQQQLGQPLPSAQQRPGAARYHSAARQQRPVPQYKLQAKVTALERTGRKDPVLRFDVYVREYLRREEATHANVLLDEPTQVSNHSIPRRPKNTFRILQACGSSHLCES